MMYTNAGKSFGMSQGIQQPPQVSDIYSPDEEKYMRTGATKSMFQLSKKDMMTNWCHHFKQGRPALHIIPGTNNEWVECDVCHARFRLKPYSDDEVEHIVGDTDSFLNQLKFFCAPFVSQGIIKEFGNIQSVLGIAGKSYSTYRGKYNEAINQSNQPTTYFNANTMSTQDAYSCLMGDYNYPMPGLENNASVMQPGLNGTSGNANQNQIIAQQQEMIRQQQALLQAQAQQMGQAGPTNVGATMGTANLPNIGGSMLSGAGDAAADAHIMRGSKPAQDPTNMGSISAVSI